MVEEEDRFGGPITEEAPGAQMRHGVESESGEIWAVARRGGRVSVLGSEDLAPVGEFDIPDDRLRAPLPTGPQRGRPVPEFTGVTTATQGGMLWLVGGLAQADWSPERLRADGPHAVIDTWILLVDPTEPALVGEVMLDRICFPIEHDLISCVIDEESRIEIRRLVF